MKTHLVFDCLWCVCGVFVIGRVIVVVCLRVFVLYEKKTCVYAPSVVLINNILCYNPNLK